MDENDIKESLLVTWCNTEEGQTDTEQVSMIKMMNRNKRFQK